MIKVVLMLIYLSLFMDAHPVMWEGAQIIRFVYLVIFVICMVITRGRYTAIGFHINQLSQHDTRVYAHLNRRLVEANTTGSQQTLWIVGIGYG